MTEDGFELPMTEMGAGGQAIDGPALRKSYAALERHLGRFPNVLVARTIGEGCGFRISLLSALGHPPDLEANLEVRAEECIPEGTFYLMVDSDVVSTFDRTEAKREAIRSVGRQIRGEGS